MPLEINGKDYKFAKNVKFGIYRRFRESPEEIDNSMAFIKAVLVPTPTEEEIDNFDMPDQIFLIFKEYGEFQKEQSTEIKKKLST